jgi:hypothetical protein
MPDLFPFGFGVFRRSLVGLEEKAKAAGKLPSALASDDDGLGDVAVESCREEDALVAAGCCG